MIVIPDSQRTKLQTPRSNFSLYFSRMTDWEIRNAIDKKNDAIVELGRAGNDHLKHAASVLSAIHRRQHRLVEYAKANGQFALEIRAKLKTPFVSGLGSGHPTETGMILDRNTGMPYIPASSIKGVLRLAHSVNLLNSSELDSIWIQRGIVNKKGLFKEHPDGNQVNLDDREPTLRRYFGDTDTGAKDGVRGQLVFLDAYPEQIPTLKSDIMNPHYHKYYGASTKDREEIERGPVDCDDPIPVKFLSVAEGTVFIFRVLASSLIQPDKNEPDQVLRTFGPDDEKAVQAMFSTAFDELGFGGKTSIGYGRFVLAEDDSSSGKEPFPASNASILATTTHTIWETASVTWAANTATLIVQYEGKRVQATDKNLVPEKYHKKLFKDKKAVTAKVTVQSTGNLFKILKID